MGDAVPVYLLQAEGLGIKIGIIPEAGHDLGVVLQDRVRVLEVRCQTAVLGLDRPAVLGLGDLAVVLADHRLNGNGHAGHKARAAALIALLKEVVDEAADNEGWAQLDGLSGRILIKQPNFNVKDYGYSKFIKLIEACESSFLIDKEHLIKKKTKTIKRMCIKNK